MVSDLRDPAEPPNNKSSAFDCRACSWALVAGFHASVDMLRPVGSEVVLWRSGSAGCPVLNLRRFSWLPAYRRWCGSRARSCAPLASTALFHREGFCSEGAQLREPVSLSGQSL